MAVEDELLAARRLAFIRSLPYLAWIGIVPHMKGPGAIIDIMAAEVEAVLAGESTLQSVRAAARRRLLKFGSGEDVIIDHPAYLSLLQWHSQQGVQQDRSITAIAPFEFLEPRMRVRDLMNQSMRSEDEVRLAFERQHLALTKEIKASGDKRITDAEQRSLEFLKSVLDVRRSPSKTVRELVLGGYALCGVDESDIGTDTTIGDLDRLVTFRCQLRVIALL